ncbi:hypothetical protein ACTG2S_19795 [Aeromonas sp. 82P]|uniref:hypothetical protein n=1 Tax=Aeromonas TaxID=642 RepID=UPI0018607317|nr:hypothetical protein FT670_12330 [Aeromonas jandaei]HDX8642727.1 hypothetical protein [Aeromonas dhakensis]
MAPKFVSIQGHSIRLSNVKSFGISEADPALDPLTAAETAKKIEDEKKKQYEQKLNGGSWLVLGIALLDKYLESKKPPEPSKPARYYFYVTSFQDDNYRFYGYKTEVERYQKIVEDALASA